MHRGIGDFFYKRITGGGEAYLEPLICILNGNTYFNLKIYFQQTLAYRNYASRMGTLLHLEEIQHQLDIREFDMNRVRFFYLII